MARKPKLTSGQRGLRHIGDVGGTVARLATGTFKMPTGGQKRGPRFKKAPGKK